MSTDNTSSSKHALKILEATQSATGQWYPADDSVDADLCLCFKVAPGGGAVTIEGAYDKDDEVTVTVVDGETDDCVVYARNQPCFAKVRASVADPTGTATVWLVR